MGRKITVLAFVLLIVSGWILSDCLLAQALMEQKETPLIIQSFASKEIRPGDTWRVYLKASDPDGRMKYIFATVSQPGIGIYPVSIIRISGENQKELSGYIYLNTAPTRLPAFFNGLLTLTVTIQRKGGQFSQPVVFPLFFQAKATKEGPPEGVFKEQELGPIMVTLRTGIRR